MDVERTAIHGACITERPAAGCTRRGAGSWEACLDEASGETYFVNSVTGESRWQDDMPTKWEVSARTDWA